MTTQEADDELNKTKKPLWHHSVKYSDQIANGDTHDDKEVEDEADPNDVVADDDGFVNQGQISQNKIAEWARNHNLVQKNGKFNMAQVKAQIKAMHKANLAAKAKTQAKAKAEALAKAKAVAKAKAEAEAKERRELWERSVKYSDQLANGDQDDDKELEDEDDPEDPIADDDGFVNQFKIDPAKLSDYHWREKYQRVIDARNSLVQAEQEMLMLEGDG